MITYAIEFVFCAFAVHVAVQFASGLVSLWNSEKSAPLVENKECKWAEERIAELYAEALQDEGFLQEFEPVAPQPVFVDVVVPFVRPIKSATEPVSVADLLQPKSIRQLKKIASACKLPKYCNDSKNRLIARLLSEVDSTRLQEAIAS